MMHEIVKEKEIVKERTITDGYWETDGEIAIYHEIGMPDIALNETSLRTTIKNAESQRSSYCTQEAWERQLDKYKKGLAILLSRRLHLEIINRIK